MQSHCSNSKIEETSKWTGKSRKGMSRMSSLEYALRERANVTDDIWKLKKIIDFQSSYYFRNITHLRSTI